MVTGLEQRGDRLPVSCRTLAGHDKWAREADLRHVRIPGRVRTHQGGVAAAKARGRLGGRPPAMTPAKLETARDLRPKGKKLQKIAETLSVSMSSLTKALGPRTGKVAPEPEAIARTVA